MMNSKDTSTSLNGGGIAKIGDKFQSPTLIPMVSNDSTNSNNIQEFFHVN